MHLKLISNKIESLKKTIMMLNKGIKLYEKDEKSVLLMRKKIAQLLDEARLLKIMEQLGDE